MSVTTYDVYVANIPLHYTEDKLRDIFDVAGEIAGIKYLPPKPDKDGKIAFVKFKKEADAQCVAQYMGNYECSDGTKLMVRYGDRVKRAPSKQFSNANGNNRDNTLNVFTSPEKVPTPMIPPPQSPHSNVTPTKTLSQTKTPTPTPTKTPVSPKGVTDTSSPAIITSVEETKVIYVSHVETPIEFYGHTYNQEFAMKLDVLTKSLEALCPSQPQVVGQLSTESIYGCKFSLDGLWYRCKIQKCLPKNEVLIRFIDYGNTEITERFGLVALPAEVLDLPPLCQQFMVDGLELIDKNPSSELYSKGLEVLDSLIREQRVELKVLKRDKMNKQIIRIIKVLDKLIDVETFLLVSGAVRLKKKDEPLLLKESPKPKPSIRELSPTPFPSTSTVASTESGFVMVESKDVIQNVESLSDAPEQGTNTENLASCDAETTTKTKNRELINAETNTKLQETADVETCTPTLSNQDAETCTKSQTTADVETCTPTPSYNDVETSTQGTANVETNTKSVQKDVDAKSTIMIDAETSSSYSLKDAETNTVKNRGDKVETDIKRKSEIKDVHASFEIDGHLDDRLDDYVKEIYKKKREIEALKKQLDEKTSVVDEYLKKIPTPGSKRDLWEIYDDPVYCNEIKTKTGTTNDREELFPIKNIQSYRREIYELEDLIEAPISHCKLFKDVGIRPSHGVLVTGPHGTGKTTIARGVVNNMKSKVIELKGQRLSSEPTLNIIHSLRKAFQRNGRPSIIFIDEIDKLAPKYPTEDSQRIVAQIINLWSDMDTNEFVVLATANGDIDPLLKRHGLFEREIKIHSPDVNQRLDILNNLTSKMSLRTDVNIKKVAMETHGYVAADLATMCNIAGMQVVRRKMASLRLRKDEGFTVDKDSLTGTGGILTEKELKASEALQVSVTVSMKDFLYAILSTKPYLQNQQTASVRQLESGMQKCKVQDTPRANESPVKKTRDLTSDCSELLNESFESCDSNLDGDYDDRRYNGRASHDVNCDEPSYRDGDEVEGWNAALLKKKPRNPTAAPSSPPSLKNTDDFF